VRWYEGRFLARADIKGDSLIAHFARRKQQPSKKPTLLFWTQVVGTCRQKM